LDKKRDYLTEGGVGFIAGSQVVSFLHS